jgi:hypothetical protein
MKFSPFPKKQQNQYQARVHHTTIDDILKAEPVIADMFSINNYPTIKLVKHLQESISKR